MSLIGPRPERPAFCAEFEKRIHGWHYRTMVAPGLSGLAQVTGGYDLLGTLIPTEADDRPTIPLIDLRIVSDATGLGSEGLAPLFHWRDAVGGYNECCEGVCEHPERSLVYLGNLERLGILERCEHYAENDKEKLLAFEASNAVAVAKEKESLKDGEKFETRRWCYQVTDFGLNFIKVCVSQT